MENGKMHSGHKELLPWHNDFTNEAQRSQMR